MTAVHSIIYDKPIEQVVLLVAMAAEAAPMIESMGLKKSELGLTRQLQLRTYSGKILGRTIHLVVNATDPDYSVDQVGTEAAAVSASNVLARLRPDTLISAGTAGGFAERGAKIGDVVMSRGGFFFHDHNIPMDGGYEDYARGSYPCLELPAVAHYFRLKSGVISTGNSLSLTAQEQGRIEQCGAIAKEMEVAAIAKIARQFNTRVMAFKAITNIVGLQKNASAEFKKNFELATQNLARVLPKILHYILGKTPQQLQAAVDAAEWVA